MFGEDPQSSGRWPNRLSSRVWPSRWNRLLGSFNPISRNFNRRSSNCSEKILKVFLMIQHFLDTGSEAQLCCDSKTMVELDDFSRLNMARLLWKSILQVASLPSPCGRCHRALFHVFWFSVGCWQVRPGKCHANGHGVAWEQGHESWSEKKTSSLRPSQPSHWNSSSLRPLRFEKFSERTIKAVRSCPSCLEMMRWLFGSSPFFSICKRLFRLWKSLKTDVDFVQAVMLAQEEAKKIQQAWHPVEHDKRH